MAGPSRRLAEVAVRPQVRRLVAEAAAWFAADLGLLAAPEVRWYAGGPTWGVYRPATPRAVWLNVSTLERGLAWAYETLAHEMTHYRCDYALRLAGKAPVRRPDDEQQAEAYARDAARRYARHLYKEQR
jgi:hypothetical protein